MASKDFYFMRAGKLHFFCPLCKHHQSTSTIQSITWKHHAQMAVVTAAVSYLLWPFFGPKSIPFYLIYWAGFEFFYRLRKRDALICESCGFDPFLYMQDVDKARKALKKHWEIRIEKENLFSGLKLKNYKTAVVNKEAAAPPAQEKSPSPASEARTP